MYKAMIKKSKNKKGFTLVELIVVMAILAILAAILIPSVGGMIQRSNKAVDVATARNLYMAGTMMVANNKSGSVTVDSNGYSSPTTPDSIFTDFIGTTAPTLKHATSMTVHYNHTTGNVLVTVNSNATNASTRYSATSGSINWPS